MEARLRQTVLEIFYESNYLERRHDSFEQKMFSELPTAFHGTANQLIPSAKYGVQFVQTEKIKKQLHRNLFSQFLSMFCMLCKFVFTIGIFKLVSLLKVKYLYFMAQKP